MLPDDAPVPVYIFTGFLGAGKTSLISRLIEEEAFSHSALVINEVGEIGIDQDLLSSTDAPAPVLLKNGCVCCSMNDDLGAALRDLLLCRSEGTIPDFHRIIIETTGVAEPALLLRRLLTDRWIMRRFELVNMITVVDSVVGARTLDAQPEALAQLAYADVVAVTKLDLAPPGAAEPITALIHGINPGAAVVPLAPTILDPLVFLRSGAEPVRTPPVSPSAHRHAHPYPVKTASLRFRHRLAWNDLASMLDRLLARYDRRILRLKGIVGVSERNAPVLINAVQSLFHPPRLLPQWPDDDDTSRLVVIGRDASGQHLLDELEREIEAAAQPLCQPAAMF